MTGAVWIGVDTDEPRGSVEFFCAVGCAVAACGWVRGFGALMALCGDER